jgi:YfiH family protein
VFHKDTHRVYRVSEFQRLRWLEHGFGTRLSEKWPPEPLVSLRQVHSDRCLVADGPTGCVGEGDALITTTPGRFLSVRTADCIPILIVDERLRAVAAVHAGWRGTVQEIAPKTAKALAAAFGSRMEDLAVAIGPGICGKCYTVGPEVASRLRSWFPERSDLDRQTTVDLTEANRRQLINAGVSSARIVSGAPCTFCSADEFHSFRRTGEHKGRMISGIAVAG